MIRGKMFDIRGEIENILKRIDTAYNKRSKDIKTCKPMLVAVSKTKSIDLIIEAYAGGHRHFGENYAQELINKALDAELMTKCPDIQWHFIGHLQSKRVNRIVRLPNLCMIQTVDSDKLANTLNRAWEMVERGNKKPLRVLIQVNTSGEAAKNGVTPEDAPILYKHICQNLKYLQVEGLMTIGAAGHDYSKGPNPDFITLMKVGNKICEQNNLTADQIQLSMGMSDDFEHAIEMGSTIVRIGSLIFGCRN